MPDFGQLIFPAKSDVRAICKSRPSARQKIQSFQILRKTVTIGPAIGELYYLTGKFKFAKIRLPASDKVHIKMKLTNSRFVSRLTVFQLFWQQITPNYSFSGHRSGFLRVLFRILRRVYRVPHFLLSSYFAICLRRDPNPWSVSRQIFPKIIGLVSKGGSNYLAPQTLETQP